MEDKDIPCGSLMNFFGKSLIDSRSCQQEDRSEILPKPWTFETRSPKTVKRDPFEAEFFTGEEESEEVYGRTDALVREAIQNSLDAPASDGLPIRIRFFLSMPSDTISPDEAKPYLDGLLPHLDALKNDFVNSGSVPAMDFLVIEDFGTRGLTGDPMRTTDPPDGSGEDFYWFWRNVGRSGKGGAERGRWGLGKTVFPATSKINTLFGLTVRSTDHRRMLMGQAITKIHRIGSTDYDPEGFYCDPSLSADLQMPIESADALDSFSSTFHLSRTTEPGLSIVVPYRFQRLSASEVVKSVIVHFWLLAVAGG
jgi:hypothetical protein